MPVTYSDEIFSKIDIPYWISRWDAMQEYYNPDRKERFDTLISLVKAKNDSPELILDLGCGTGSVMLECLLAFPNAQVKGIDFNFTREDAEIELKKQAHKEQNRLEYLENQLKWLSKIGFKDVDCYHKIFEIAVFGGRKY